jgi:fatty-acyl-CoA synthase
MKSTIMDYNLSLNNIFWRVEKLYYDREIVSRLSDKIFKYTYKDFALRVRKLSNFVLNKGIRRGDVVGSIAWNTHRHLELYFAIPLINSVLHTINVRFHPSEMSYVIDAANDKLVFYEEDLSGSIREIKGKTKASLIPLSKETDEEIDSFNPVEKYEEIDEREGAVICYTSGTTGHPKGVVYSHRSIFIHSLALLPKDVTGISSNEVVMPVVPMFHISSWDIPYASLMTGAKLVLPGPRPQPEDLFNLIKREGVTIATGAPTVWISFLDYILKERLDISPLKVIITGGAEPPKGLMKTLKDKFSVRTIHAWGMTETEAITTVNLSEDLDFLNKQGIPMPGIEYTAIDENGREIRWNGKDMGELIIRGAWVTDGYYNNPEKSKEIMVEMEGKKWLRTGDMVNIDENGFIKVVDRKKDLIKSGGEWISSVDLENAIMSFPPVLEAVAIGVKDEKWGERPIAMVVLREEFKGKVKEEDIKDFLMSINKFPKWWIPDKIVFVDSIPKTSTGKLDKKVVREKVKEILKQSQT